MIQRQTQALELAIDSLKESYRNGLEINNLESAALPNRRAVIDAFNLLVPTLYLGFYSTKSLNHDHLRYAISEHLYPTHEILVEQISRALTYEAQLGRRRVEHTASRAEDVVIELFRALPRLRQVLNTDVLAAYDGDPSAKSIEEVVFSFPTVRAVTAHRIAHELYLAKVPLIPRIIAEYAHSETGIDIHAGATIGEHFFIDHGTGVVIGETTKIGRNVKIYQGVTLGAMSNRGASHKHGRVEQRHPTLEDNVTVYSGVTILGGKTVIGSDSVIGGNLFVTHSVPAGTRLMGRERTGSSG